LPDQLSSDLAALKIDRGSAPRTGGGALRAVFWIALLGAIGYAGYAVSVPYLEARFFKVEVAVTEVALHSPAQAAIELTSSGYVQPQVISRVGAKIPGRVARVHVREGQSVKAGDLLLELERADREAGIQSARMRAAAAQARVATASATLAETRLQATRQRKLAETGVAPAANAEDLEARVLSLVQAQRASEAEVKAAEAEVAALKVDLQYMRIEAPIDGTVINEPPEAGELLGTDLTVAGGSSKVIELADFRTLMVETDVPEGRLHMAKVGSPCEITLDAFPGKRFRGEAVEVSPRVSRAKATVEVKVKFVDDAAGVLPDMAARVSFLSAPLDAAKLAEKARPVVPESALAERAGGKVVFVVEGDRVRMRPVVLGEKLAGGYELRDGPAPGTKLVSGPPQTLADGQRIKEKS
jgi:RND family efflux transporter MFP subunit